PLHPVGLHRAAQHRRDQSRRLRWRIQDLRERHRPQFRLPLVAEGGIMNARIHLWLAAAALAAAITGCSKMEAITQPAAQSGSANFSVYASMGTSITAGWESGGLVDHHQRQSYPYLFARQVGAASFTYPSVTPDGVRPLLRIVSFSPLIISNAGR